MATGRETSYNYNNGSYSSTGYPFSKDQLSLQASYSSSLYDADNLQSIVYVAITLNNIGIDWGYQSGREVNVYWNDNLVASFAPPNLKTVLDRSHVTTIGSASFIVQHTDEEVLTGTLKVEWNTVVLAYTVDGVTKNITELGCKADVMLEAVDGKPPTDLLVINGKSFLSIIQENGIEVARATVNKKSVLTMDGTEWINEKNKHTIAVKLLDMSADQYAEYAAYLNTNPASVLYKDSETGQAITSVFYITDIKYTKKKVITGLTYLTDISFNLSEKTAT